MAEPVCRVAFKPGQGPLPPAPTEWEALDDPANNWRVAGLTVNRGRSTELSQTGTGTGTVEIADPDGELDSQNPAGPYSPDTIHPGNPFVLSLRNPVADTWHRLFTGLANSVNYQLTWPTLDLQVELVDVFQVLSDNTFVLAGGTSGPNPFDYQVYSLGGTPLTGVVWSSGDIIFSQQTLADRLGTALDIVSGDLPREIEASVDTYCGEVTYSRDTPTMQMLTDAADVDVPSNLFVRGDGTIVFHGRDYRIGPAGTGPPLNDWYAATGDLAAGDDTYAVLSGIEWSVARDRVVNIAVSVPKDSEGVDVSNIVKDDDSIGRYGPRSIVFDDLIYLEFLGATPPFDYSLSQPQTLSQYWVASYADAAAVPSRLTFRPQHPAGFSGPAQWALLCGIEIGDMLHLRTTHRFGGGFGYPLPDTPLPPGEEELRLLVEGLQWTVRPGPGDWDNVTLDVAVSPAAALNPGPY